MSNKRDYYEILGVSRNATKSEIKSAFRKLAMEYHPDRNKEEGAEAKFKEIGEAYEVLHDDEKRKIYDQFGHDGFKHGGATGFSEFNFNGDFGDIFSSFFGGSGMGSMFRNRRNNSNIQAQLNISLKDSIFGATITQKLNKYEPCETCDGYGAVNHGDIVSCVHCDGRGVIDRVSHTPFGKFKQQTSCSYCAGTGETNKNPCRTCHGKKFIKNLKEVDIKIPAGIRDGEAIKIRGYGNVSTNNNVGDLILIISINPDKHFSIDGYNLILHLPLSALNALTNSKIGVPTLYGIKDVKIPSNLKSGDHIIIKNCGLPKGAWYKKGDLYVIFDLYVPKIDKNSMKQIEDIKSNIKDTIYNDFLKEFDL